jgi:hypothetical protein
MVATFVAWDRVVSTRRWHAADACGLRRFEWSFGALSVPETIEGPSESMWPPFFMFLVKNMICLAARLRECLQASLNLDRNIFSQINQKPNESIGKVQSSFYWQKSSHPLRCLQRKQVSGCQQSKTFSKESVRRTRLEADFLALVIDVVSEKNESFSSTAMARRFGVCPLPILTLLSD